MRTRYRGSLVQESRTQGGRADLGVKFDVGPSPCPHAILSAMPCPPRGRGDGSRSADAIATPFVRAGGSGIEAASEARVGVSMPPVTRSEPLTEQLIAIDVHSPTHTRAPGIWGPSGIEGEDGRRA